MTDAEVKCRSVATLTGWEVWYKPINSSLLRGRRKGSILMKCPHDGTYGNANDWGHAKRIIIRQEKLWILAGIITQ